MSAKPPLLVRALSGLLMGTAAIALAAAIMVQWFYWLVLGQALWDPWGMGLGVVVFAVQLFGLFGGKQEEVCEIPRS